VARVATKIIARPRSVFSSDHQRTQPAEIYAETPVSHHVADFSQRVARAGVAICNLNATGEGHLMATPQKLSGIVLQAFQSRHCFGEDLFRRQMATQKHLNCEGESCSMLADKCAPHVFLTCLKFLTCHDGPSCLPAAWLLNINILRAT
jgi:hypothetical protein